MEDQIKQTGWIQPKLNIAGTEDLTLTYAWYRSDDGGASWTKVERKRVTGDSYNVAQDGSWLNVALDQGANKWYKVALVSINGTQQPSPIESQPYQIPYFDSLQNGSFEAPAISTDVSDAEHYQPILPNGTAGMIWKTTADDGEVEFVSVASDEFRYMSNKWHNCSEAADGSQFVELNAKMEGALYQDVLTAPGSTMYWRLAHHARGAQNSTRSASMQDTMYVVIMSTALAEAYRITTQDKVNDVINNSAQYPGAQVAKITDDNIQWYYHSGEYEVPEEQYLTRYFFVAGPTDFDLYPDPTIQPKTRGNHLDDVYFSTELPPPSPGQASLHLEKTIVGLDEDTARALLKQLEFTVGSDVVSGSDFVNFTDNGDGSFTAYYLTQIDLGTEDEVTLSIAEDLASAELAGYTRAETTATKNGAAADASQPISITIQHRETGVVSYTNRYEEDTVSLKLQKVGSDNRRLSGAVFSLESFDGTAWSTVSDAIRVDADGSATIAGLHRNRLYRLTEITAPDGYYMLQEPVYFQIIVAYDRTILHPCDAEGNLVPDWQSLVKDLTKDVLCLQITNEQGMILPETGGMGREPIYFAGFGLLCGVAIYSIYVWRKNKGGSYGSSK